MDPMEQTNTHTEESSLQEKIAFERIELGLRNIDKNIFELVDKVRKPRQQLQHVANEWKRWEGAIMVGAAGLLGIWFGKTVVSFLPEPKKTHRTLETL